MRHSILFTGHMIDKGDRLDSRFPANKEISVSKEILKQLLSIKETETKELIGIAGGACGGDILFHERCIKIGIDSEMYLALPTEEYKKQSVSFAGEGWEERFDKLINRLTVHILPKEKRSDEKSNIWSMTNEWMLESAFQSPNDNTTLIALWDGKGGDGDGGTEHMIKTAKEKGAKINIININKI